MYQVFSNLFDIVIIFILLVFSQGIFYRADSVSSSYSYEACSVWTYSSSDAVCKETATFDVDLVALTPPFIYHWQCASVLLSAYIPVFIYTYVFQFGYPIMLVLFSFVKYTTLPVWMRAKVPGTLHRVPSYNCLVVMLC